MPHSAIPASATAPQGLGPTPLPPVITITTPASPSTRPSHSTGPARAPVTSGASEATRIGCSDITIAVVPAFIPASIAR